VAPFFRDRVSRWICDEATQRDPSAFGGGTPDEVYAVKHTRRNRLRDQQRDSP